MIDFDSWWNSAAADTFRNKHEDMDGNEFRPIWDAALASTPTSTSAPYESKGYALAMRVLQSDLYRALDDRERAECDELIRIGQGAPEVAAPAPSKWIDDPHDIEQGQMLNPAWLKLHNTTAQEVHRQQQTPSAPTTEPPAAQAASSAVKEAAGCNAQDRIEDAVASALNDYEAEKIGLLGVYERIVALATPREFQQ